ncbi:MAG: uroporphyrinogen decarboxylase family protein [Oscillospiraceae bacterium]|jgi:hypothetical protein|nr:uroporphyrinogen decarboxylase family protein [Oscillospiraceae bacterium]
MSYQDGWAALHMEMPARVPHYEPSANTHNKLIQAVTRLPVGDKAALQNGGWSANEAERRFLELWNFDFLWNQWVYGNAFDKGRQTNMGHAEYAENGADRDDNVHCPWTDPEEILNIDFEAEYGRIDIPAAVKSFNENWRSCQETYPFLVAPTGIYETCVSGLIQMFGWDMLLWAAGEDQKRFGEMTDRYAAYMQSYFEALAQSDSPIALIHDDMVWSSGPFIHPDWYRKYVFPNYKKYFSPLLEAGKRIVYCCDGTFTMFFDDLTACGIHTVMMECTTDMALFAERYGRTHGFIGNVDTRILLRNNREEIEQEVRRVMDIGKKCPGFICSVSNHIPCNTPVEAALWYYECYEKYARR